MRALARAPSRPILRTCTARRASRVAMATSLAADDGAYCFRNSRRFEGSILTDDSAPDAVPVVPITKVRP